MSADKLKIVTRKVMKVFLKSKYISTLLFLIVVFTLFYFTKKTLSGFTVSDFSTISVSKYFLSLGFITLAYLNRFYFWTKLTKSFNLKAPVLPVARAFYYSLLARYIPGKAGLFLFRIRAYDVKSRKKVSAALITEYISTLAAASILVLIGAMFIPDVNIYLTRWLPLFLLVLLFTLLHPKVLKFSINFLYRLFKKKPLAVFPSTKTLILLVAGYTLTGMLHGFALFLLFRVFSPIGLEFYPLVTGAYYLSGIIGILAFFSPGGLGVREGVLFILLSSIIAPKSIIITATVMRLLTLSSELILSGSAALACLIFNQRKN
ncbi:MAG: lysylphosphatidylglycerol synthase domain-containing protein [Candidatus Kariarchaeaceae archaeon]